MLELREISKRFSKQSDFADRLTRRLLKTPPPPTVHALDKVTLDIKPGEVLGLVGESGCGKSTLGRIVAGINDPSDGTLRWEGKDIGAMTRPERRQINLAVQMIFQDPFSSLNPRKRVKDSIGEAPLAHGMITRAEQADYVDDLLRQVGLDPGAKDRYPHQFSGGQRARIGIARALAVKPRFLVCDESVAALDVSIQAQVINLFMALRDQLSLTYLFISHDLGVVEHLSDRVAIMYLGRVVEVAPTDQLYGNPAHPYTQALLAEAPRISLEPRGYATIKGEIPSPLAPPPGCHFHPRCPMAGPRCSREKPALRPLSAGRLIACHLTDGGVE
ncbi:MAG: ABC transporter ATP-binding protein [Elstera sp.]